VNIADFIVRVVDEIRRGLENARRSGIDCQMPEFVEFDLAVGPDYGISVSDQGKTRIRFVVPLLSSVGRDQGPESGEPPAE
jgi:hypothetical protein